MWRRTATGPEAPPFGMGIEAFGIGPASRFATEHPALRLKRKPRVKSPASAGLFFTFPAAKQALDSTPASSIPLSARAGRARMRLARAARARVSSDTSPPIRAAHPPPLLPFP